MDERLRGVEGDVGTLKDWRHRTVDPWISSGKDFRETVGTYITSLKAQEELRQQLNDERHQANSSKLNLILAIATVGLLIVALASFYVSVQATKHSMLLPFNSSMSVIETADDARIPTLTR